MHRSIRKSLAASAVLASSVAAATGLVPSASATPAGSPTSPLTLRDGAWAPDGSRIAFVDGQNQIVTERADGTGLEVAAPAKSGITRSHPTWIADGAAIAFTEVSGTSSTLQAVEAFTPHGQTPAEGSPIAHMPGAGWVAGTETHPDSNGGMMVFQHADPATHTAQIWVQDGFSRGSVGPDYVDSGAEPSISPDGTKIAYVKPDAGGDNQLWIVGWDAANQKIVGAPAAITTDAHDKHNPTWSPDGTRIAYENGPHGGGTATDVDSVPAAGGTARVESATPGFPAYQPLNKDTMTRLSSGDRIGTAISVSQAAFKAGTGYTVVLARSDQFADALGGSALAGSRGGSLLLTPTDHLDGGVKTEIQRVLGAASTTKTVYVLGGEKALSPAVFTAVQNLGYSVKRLAGTDRYATSVAIAKEQVGTQPARVLVATGNNFPDALSAGAASQGFTGGGVVLLSNDKVMPASTGTYLQQVKAAGFGSFVYGVGGQGDAALTSVGIAHTALAGTDRYQTSYLVAKTFFDGWSYGSISPRQVGFATGLTWPDALSGGAYMAGHGGPLLLVNPATGNPGPDAQGWLSGWSPSISNGFVFGGTAAVSDPGLSFLGGLIDGPAGFTTVANPKA